MTVRRLARAAATIGAVTTVAVIAGAGTAHAEPVETVLGTRCTTVNVQSLVKFRVCDEQRSANYRPGRYHHVTATINSSSSALVFRVRVATDQGTSMADGTYTVYAGQWGSYQSAASVGISVFVDHSMTASVTFAPI